MSMSGATRRRRGFCGSGSAHGCAAWHPSLRQHEWTANWLVLFFYGENRYDVPARYGCFPKESILGFRRVLGRQSR